MPTCVVRRFVIWIVCQVAGGLDMGPRLDVAASGV